MAESVLDRLGVDPFGTKDPLVGNVFLYPRRIVLEVLRLLLVQEDMFTPIDADGTPEERNPFLLKLTPGGDIHPDSRVVLADFGTEKILNEERRPRIIVERGSGNFAGSGFSQKNFNGAWAGSNEGKRFSDLYDTSLLIRCVGRVKSESEGLGLVVSMGLWMFHDEIKKQSDLHHLSPPQVGQTVAEKFDSEVEQYVTQVTLQCQQSINWVKTQINPSVVAEICASISEL